MQPVDEHVALTLDVAVVNCSLRYTGDFREDKRNGEGILEERGKTFHVRYDEGGDHH